MIVGDPTRSRTLIAVAAGANESFVLPLRTVEGSARLNRVGSAHSMTQGGWGTVWKRPPSARRTEPRLRPLSAARCPAAHGACGFTMVELLTVIAIIAVLATLLITALANGKKKSRRLVCTSNLRQISLALNMYLDDYPQRPPGYEFLTSDRYLPAKAVLLCPEDKTGNWGGIVRDGLGGWLLPGMVPSAIVDSSGNVPVAASGPAPVPYSFLHPLPWQDWAWNVLLEQGSAAGISVCQLHGLGKPDPVAPSIYDYEGLVLRARRDGAVIHRRVYWGPRPNREAGPPATAADPSTAGSMFGNGGAAGILLGQEYPWQFFTDDIPGVSTSASPGPPPPPAP